MSLPTRWPGRGELDDEGHDGVGRDDQRDRDVVEPVT
jgi:hypothetical protein